MILKIWRRDKKTLATEEIACRFQDDNLCQINVDPTLVLNRYCRNPFEVNFVKRNGIQISKNGSSATDGNYIPHEK